MLWFAALKPEVLLLDRDVCIVRYDDTVDAHKIFTLVRMYMRHIFSSF